MVVVAFSCAVIAYRYVDSGEEPTASEIASARSQLLADLFVDEAAAPLCRAQQEQFQRMLGGQVASVPLDPPDCELEMLTTLRLVLEEAEADVAAGRPDAAFSKAGAILAYNQAVLGQRSLLAVSVSGARATQAVALMQTIAARSLNSELRAQWRREVEVLVQGQLENDQLAPAIVTGEARAYLLVDDSGAVAHGIPKADVNRMTVAYAGLLRDLERGDAFLPRCLERVGEAPVCTFLLRGDTEQQALIADVALLAKMLEPRRQAVIPRRNVIDAVGLDTDALEWAACEPTVPRPGK